jgi:hypothetical protein
VLSIAGGLLVLGSYSVSAAPLPASAQGEEARRASAPPPSQGSHGNSAAFGDLAPHFPGTRHAAQPSQTREAMESRIPKNPNDSGVHQIAAVRQLPSPFGADEDLTIHIDRNERKEWNDR